jgi:hypothetical protein
MSSLWHSTRASLDDSLALLCESLGKLKASKSVDIADVIKQLETAAEFGQRLRSLVSSELPDASWQNREELDALVEQIQKNLQARAVEQLRSRLLALATQLERGSIVHRRAFRVEQLNQLRDEAINELRSQAGVEGPPSTLPGPEADEWIEWAFGLDESDDAESLKALRNRFPRLDDLIANLEPKMWRAAESPTQGITPEPERSAEAFHGTSSTAPAIASGITASAEEPQRRKWRMLLATTAVLVLAAVGAIQWKWNRNRTSTSNGPVKSEPPLVRRQPIEGAQGMILVTIEFCQRMDSQSIECWGYVSNLRGENCNVSLSRADVVDGKGNTFKLSGVGQFDFSTGDRSTIPAGSSVKYTIKIPDKDQDARTLSLYLDLSNPRDLEYTFRDVPISNYESTIRPFGAISEALVKWEFI